VKNSWMMGFGYKSNPSALAESGGFAVLISPLLIIYKEKVRI